MTDHEEEEENVDYGDANDPKSRFWKFECITRGEFEDKAVDYDPMACYDVSLNNYSTHCNPILRFSFAHNVTDKKPKAVFCYWKLENKIVTGYIDYDQPISAKMLIRVHGPDMIPTLSIDENRKVPEGCLCQKRINDYDTKLASYQLTKKEAENVMVVNRDDNKRRFPKCRGEWCWCYDCAIQSVDGDRRNRCDEQKALEYATYVRGRYINKQ